MCSKCVCIFVMFECPIDFGMNFLIYSVQPLLFPELKLPGIRISIQDGPLWPALAEIRSIWHQIKTNFHVLVSKKDLLSLLARKRHTNNWQICSNHFCMPFVCFSVWTSRYCITSRVPWKQNSKPRMLFCMFFCNSLQNWIHICYKFTTNLLLFFCFLFLGAKRDLFSLPSSVWFFVPIL